ncbi:MAG: hypothetical protein ABSA02_08270 [Trebonia sp.]
MAVGAGAAVVGAGAGAVAGGARVGAGVAGAVVGAVVAATAAGTLDGAADWTAARAVGWLAARETWYVLAGRAAVREGAGLGVTAGLAAGAVWLAIWAGAVRAKSVATPTVARAPSCAVRQVSLPRRRRPASRVASGERS